MDVLLDPYGFEFFRNGVLVATVAGALCGVIGCFIVLRSMSYLGHGLSHAVFGGFAVATLIGVDVVLGAGVWGLLTALVITTLARRRPIGSDAAIGVVSTASFALGLALVDRYGSPAGDPDAVLFGNVVGVSVGDMWTVLVVTGVAAVGLFLGYRRLLFVTFDAEVARASAVNVALVDGLLMAVLAAAILATMNVLGVTLIAAALVIPPVVARMLTTSFPVLLVWAGLLGSVSGFVGMNASYHLDVASGPVIVLVASAIFALTYGVGGVRRWREAAAVAG